MRFPARAARSLFRVKAGALRHHGQTPEAAAGAAAKLHVVDLFSRCGAPLEIDCGIAIKSGSRRLAREELFGPVVYSTDALHARLHLDGHPSVSKIGGSPLMGQQRIGGFQTADVPWRPANPFPPRQDKGHAPRSNVLKINSAGNFFSTLVDCSKHPRAVIELDREVWGKSRDCAES